MTAGIRLNKGTVNLGCRMTWAPDLRLALGTATWSHNALLRAGSTCSWTLAWDPKRPRCAALRYSSR